MPAEKGHVGASIEQLLSDRKNSVFCLLLVERQKRESTSERAKKCGEAERRGEPPDNKNDLHCFQWDIKLSSFCL
jgi:hypothetical protein